MSTVTSAIGRLFSSSHTESRVRKPRPVRNVSYYSSGQSGRERFRL